MSEVQNQHYNAKKHENSNIKSPEMSQKTTEVHDKNDFNS